jgi:hypothetical protein
MCKRLSCAVPGCRRTTAEDHGEWVCAKHWPNVSRKLKQELATARQAHKRSNDRASWGRFGEAWARCRDAAILEALGIGASP